MKKLILLIMSCCSITLSAEDSIQAAQRADKFFNQQVILLQNGTLDERIEAIGNLKLLRSRKAVRPLIVALKGLPDFPLVPDNSPQLRFFAAQALAHFGEEDAIKPLIEVFNSLEKTITEKDRPAAEKTDDYNVVMALGEMLRSLGSLPYSKESFDLIKTSLTHANFYIRSSAADAFFYMKKREAIDPLKAAVASEKIEYAKASMLYALISLEKNAETHFHVLKEMLTSTDKSVRYKASYYLGDLGMLAAVPYLKKAHLIEEDSNIREQMKKDIEKLIDTNNKPDKMPTY